MGGKEIFVIKRNGASEPLDFEKINQVLLWATEGINGVSASDIAMNAQIQIYDGITTNEIHKVLIQSSVDLISEKTPNYQIVGGNLLNYYIRKDVFDSDNDNLPHLLDVIKANVDRGIYDKKILNDYT
jgi:ribonucleoside-diphosphate reductase alpha chain